MSYACVRFVGRFGDGVFLNVGGVFGPLLAAGGGAEVYARYLYIHI